ncbi:MAG: hypothetical protein SVR08_15090 [Spirochaetota bacterium]|nr:hypothetical protein [Spirochaetota bacterium]
MPMHFRTLKMSSFHRNRLRLAFSSAGALDEEDAAHFLDQTGLGITEIYGSTETGGIASMSRAQDEKAWNPFEVVDFRIVKDRLHVRSDFISPDLPLNPDQFFITEDRAVYYDQRSFLLLGRADDIVKVAGKRVDLGEVQNKIKDINGVKNAYVLSLPVKKGRGNEIAALIAADVDEAYIRRSISQILESYAVPRRIRVVNEIPETSTGKYDYKSIKMKFFSK